VIPLLRTIDLQRVFLDGAPVIFATARSFKFGGTVRRSGPSLIGPWKVEHGSWRG
jgi:hypothetical protein